MLDEKNMAKQALNSKGEGMERRNLSFAENCQGVPLVAGYYASVVLQ